MGSKGEEKGLSTGKRSAIARATIRMLEELQMPWVHFACRLDLAKPTPQPPTSPSSEPTRFALRVGLAIEYDAQLFSAGLQQFHVNIFSRPRVHFPAEILRVWLQASKGQPRGQLTPATRPFLRVAAF